MNPGEQRSDPWQNTTVQCVAYPRSPAFIAALQELLGDEVAMVETPDVRPDQVVLVDCRQLAQGMMAARRRYPTQPLVGVIAESESETILEILAAGADGVVAMTEPAEAWHECINVVRGGARWLGGSPAVHVNLEQKNASYDVAKREKHAGDVTMRTKLFIKHRVTDKFGR